MAKIETITTLSGLPDQFWFMIIRKGPSKRIFINAFLRRQPIWFEVAKNARTFRVRVQIDTVTLGDGELHFKGEFDRADVEGRYKYEYPGRKLTPAETAGSICFPTFSP